MKRILIIDDEMDARQSLRVLLNSLCPDVEICGEADSVQSAYVLIRQTRPHAILLDISLGGETGFDLLDRFSSPDFQVIFTTAYDEFALKAFRYHALDYLLKPINPAELAETMDRVKPEKEEDFSARISHLLESIHSRQINKITLTSQEGMVFLHLDQIVHLESDASYTTFFLMTERHLVARPMKSFEELLPKEKFFKLHQSHIVNLAFVKKILREEGGSVLMEDGYKIPIARRRKEAFLAAIKDSFNGSF